MIYGVYYKRTQRAARETGGSFVSLAGGYFGVAVPLDGVTAILAMDLDGRGEWLTWSEDRNGERCCDDNAVELGQISTSDLASLPTRAASALLDHECLTF